MSPPLTVNIMTATLTPGDAIGNYVLTSARIWRRWGVRVNLYADSIAPVYGGLAQPSHFYRDSGAGLLWYHYSIYANNVEIARASRDFTVMDFHGISPPRLFAGQDAHLQQLCQRGIDLLPALAADFDAYVVHSDYTRQELRRHGYADGRINKLPLVVDTARFDTIDPELAATLKPLDYLLFIGRIVPQKDILRLIDIFDEVHPHRPDTALVLVGSRHIAPTYQRQIDRAVAIRGLQKRVLFAGQVNDPRQLAALLAEARLLLVTSEWETFCVPVVESMFFGTPPVVHRVDPLPEVAGSGGVVVDKQDVAPTAETIVALLGDNGRYAQLSQAARQRAADFTDSALETALLAMLKELFLRE